MSGKLQKIGRWGEEAAAAYLQGRGYAILARNLRTPHGELDIIAQKGELLVFIEVKARTSSSFAHPEDSVTPRKQMHMQMAAGQYLDLHPDSPETWQFDVISVERGAGGKPVITHFENVIG